MNKSATRAAKAYTVNLQDQAVRRGKGRQQRQMPGAVGRSRCPPVLPALACG